MTITNCVCASVKEPSTQDQCNNEDYQRQMDHSFDSFYGKQHILCCSLKVQIHGQFFFAKFLTPCNLFC